MMKVGDRVKTPDGKIITIQGILDVQSTTYHASNCHLLTEAEAHAAKQDDPAGKQQTTAARPGTVVPSVIIWGT